jgi:hypothetical protein
MLLNSNSTEKDNDNLNDMEIAFNAGHAWAGAT